MPSKCAQCKTIRPISALSLPAWSMAPFPARLTAARRPTLRCLDIGVHMICKSEPFPVREDADVHTSLLNRPPSDHQAFKHGPPQLKLTYFEYIGCNEITRLVLHYGGIPFTDECISRAKFLELKPTLPLGQLPVLEVDGKVFSQSIAIARYAAKLAGLYPTDPVEALRVNMIVDSTSELIAARVAMAHEKDEAARAMMNNRYFDTTLPTICSALETMVQGKFFRADSVSLADFALFDVVENFLKPRFETFDLDEHSKLSAVVANVKALPAIVAYLAK